MIIGETAYQNVHGFTDAELQRMRDYLLGAVQAWCKAVSVQKCSEVLHKEILQSECYEDYGYPSYIFR